MFEAQKKLATRSLYAAIGAPVVATKRAREVGDKIADLTSQLRAGAQTRFNDMVGEGEKVADQLRSRNVVGELQNRVDLEKVQDRVEKLRDQLEQALTTWRETFETSVGGASKPRSDTKAAETEARTPSTRATASKKPAAKTATTKKPAARTRATAKSGTTKSSDSSTKRKSSATRSRSKTASPKTGS